MAVEQVIIEFIPDLSQLQSAEDRLTALGKIDQKSAQIFKATNDQLKDRSKITNDISSANTKQEQIIAKLSASLKTLSGESKNAVQNLLKLSGQELSAGFVQAGISVDDYIDSLKKVGSTSVSFKPVSDQLKTQDLLHGKLTISVSKEQAAVNKLVASMKTLTGESKSAVQALLKQSTEEITQGFRDAGVTVDQYIKGLQSVEGASDGVEKSTVKLKSQLRGMVEELAVLKLAGEDQSEAYRKLAAEAGNLSDTIGDVGAEVRRLGSDTSTFDGLIAGAQGLAGGFAGAQGAIALFGGQGEELQETLVKVSASMAILQGLQQVSALVEKESAASLLIVNVQRKIQNAQIVVENGLQSRSIIVRTGAAVAQRVLNAAMAANPIGIVITALVTVIGLFALYANSAKKAAQQQAALNGALQEAEQGLDGEIAGIKRANSARVSELEAAGAKQSEVLRANAQAEVAIEAARRRQIAEIDKTIAATKATNDESTLESLKKLNDKRFDLEQQSMDASLELENKNREGRKQILQESLEDAVSIKQAEVDKVLALGGKNTGKEFDARKALARAESALEIQNAGENSAKIAAIRQKLANDLRQIDMQAREQRQRDTLAALNTELIAAQNNSRKINERTSQEEIDAQKKIIIATARFESEQDGLSQKQRTEIRAKALQETAELQREFNRKSIEESLQDYISLNNVQLARVGIDEQEKLNLKIDNIIAAASIEEAQNIGLSAKIKEINAKRDADIKAARLQSIQETLVLELREREVAGAEENRLIDRTLSAQSQLRNAPNSQARRMLEEQLGVKRIALQEENSLIDDQTRFTLDGLKKQQDALRKTFTQGLISRKEYQLSNAELVDKEVQAVEDGEDKKRKAAAETFELQKRLDKQRIDLAIEISSEVAGLLAGLSDLQSTRENQKIEDQKRKVNELKAAGSLTEKEAIDRLKKIDQEERKVKYQAAVRDKQLAIFNAIIATAASVAKVASVPPLAILAAALGAAQVAIIAARPIPKFAKGKKDQYQGLGQVGEAGSELIESRGQLFVTKKPTIVWLGKADKVYNPKETKAILDRQIPIVNNNSTVVNKDIKPAQIDYDRLGKAIGKHTSTTLSIDGYKDFIKEQQSFTTYLNKRRGY